MLGLLRYAQPQRRRLRSPWWQGGGCQLRLEELESRTLLAVYAPAQIAHAYGFDQLPYDGSGQTIAIVDAYGNPNVAYDLSIFDSIFGLPAPVLTIAQPQGRPFVNSVNWALETDLDVQWAHAIAPGANILLVVARSSSFDDMLGAVDYARQQPGVVAVSMSWGSYEFFGEAISDSSFSTPPGHIGGSGLPGGITFVAASGDSGGVVEWPAAAPSVLSIGGTTLMLDDGNAILSETGWSQSGGGVSKYEPQPDYQVPFQSYGMRTTPDVSYSADSASAYWVYDTFGYGGTQAVFGTSAGTPQWAGLIALVDQGLALNNQGALDGPSQVLPALYNLASISYGTYYNDIVDGNNGYQAGPGYDLVTGIGSPIANQIVQGLVNGSQSPGGGARAPRSPGENLLAGSKLMHATRPHMSPPRLAVAPEPLPGHPENVQKSPPAMQGHFLHQPIALLLAALANSAPASGQIAYGVPSSPDIAAQTRTGGNKAVPIVQPILAPTPPLRESPIESGGGDSNDNGAEEVPMPPASDSIPGAVSVVPDPLVSQDIVAAGSWQRACNACFDADGGSGTSAVLESTRGSAGAPFGVLPDPLAAAGAVAIALGGYWTRQSRESETSYRRFDKVSVLG